MTYVVSSLYIYIYIFPVIWEFDTDGQLYYYGMFFDVE